MSKRRKAVAPKKPARPKRASAGRQVVDLSDDDIRMRAYFIAEHRMRLALPGDPSADWLEAKRQLLAETNGSNSLH